MLGIEQAFSCTYDAEIGAIELGSAQSQFCLFNQFLISMQVNLMQYAWGCFLLHCITAVENLQQLAFHVSLWFFLCSVPCHGIALITLYVKAHQICILVYQAETSYERYDRSWAWVMSCTWLLILQYAAVQRSTRGLLVCLRAEQLLSVLVSSYECGHQNILMSMYCLLSKVFEEAATLHSRIWIPTGDFCFWRKNCPIWFCTTGVFWKSG